MTSAARQPRADWAALGCGVVICLALELSSKTHEAPRIRLRSGLIGAQFVRSRRLAVGGYRVGLTRETIGTMQRQHFYRGVTGLGHVAVSRHTQEKMDREDISQELFERVLLKSVKARRAGGFGYNLARAGKNVRLVMINPTPATPKRCSGLSHRGECGYSWYPKPSAMVAPKF